MSASLTFLGAAQTVTGSKHLLEVNGQRLLVDCGLFQGTKELRERNWGELPFEPASLAAVVLTHAHIDHSGYLPRLVAAGFKGRIYCTAGTLDLCRLVLPDAGRLQEEDARQANKHGYSRHKPALPLFTEADAYKAISQLQPFGYERPVEVMPGVEMDFVPAGHLLGSAYARVHVRGAAGGNGGSAGRAAGGKDRHGGSDAGSGNGADSGNDGGNGDGKRRGLRILFGGDLGRYGRPVLPDPTPVDGADVLLVESTYGDRVHEQDDDGHALEAIIHEAVARKGKIIIPSFAIGRTEEVLYWIKRLEEEKRIPVLPVYVDSPMAVEALRYYSERSNELDKELNGPGRAVKIFATTRFTTVQSVQQSKDLTASNLPAIVISASGMATGGRVLHHLAKALPDPRHTVLFVGYQAEGTRGRALVDGATTVKIHGQDVPVAAKIVKLDSMSAHADREEILRWLGGFTQPPAMTYLVHGEPSAMFALAQTITDRLGWKTHRPALGETVQLPEPPSD